MRTRTTTRTTRLAAVAAALAVAAGLGAVAAPAEHAGAQPATGQGAQGSPGSPGSDAAQLARRFADPPVDYRPLYRYWHPGGRMDPATLEQELRAIRDGGGGGVELANFVRNNSVAPIQDYDRSTEGFGTDAWRARFDDAYRIGERLGLEVDTTYTSKYSANLPTVSPDGPGSAKELSLTSVRLTAGQGYDDQLPRPTLPGGVQRSDLVAVRAYPCQDRCDGAVPVLDVKDSVDLTDRAGDGRLAWTAPEGGDRSWTVVASWSHGTGQQVLGEETPRESFLVDHFSRAGLDAVEDFWRQHLLDADVRARLRESGGSLFFDSLELNRDGNQLRHWTPAFLAEFERRRGYDVEPYLPMLALTTPSYEVAGGIGERVREDYRRTLNDLFRDEHVKPLKTWAHGLGLTLRGQPYTSWGPSFTDPIDLWSQLDIPEGEDRSFGKGASQGFIETVGSDAWRSAATTAQVNGTGLVSDECCASFGRAHRVTRQKLLSHVNQAFSVGVNHVVWHGWSHNAPGTAASWPGWSGFGNTGVDDSYGPRNPTWADDTRINDYVGRLQVALRAGRQLDDVAIYHQKPGHSAAGTTGERYFASGALEHLGYTYGFVNGSLLTGDRTPVRNGVLAPDGPAFQALVVDREQAMDPDVARRIADAARAGLAVVVVGDAPTQARGYRPAEDDAVRAAFAGLRGNDRVRWVATEDDVPSALAGLGVTPRASFTDAAGLVGVHRSAPSLDLYYWYNTAAQRTRTTVSLPAGGTPYTLDPWTGEITPIGQYVERGGRIEVPLDVASGDGVLVAVSNRPLAGPKPKDHVTQVSGGQVVVDGAAPVLRATEDGDYATTLAGARPVTTRVSGLPQQRTLGDWDLTVHSWHRGSGPQDTAVDDLPTQHVTAAADGHLPSWDQVPGVGGSVSGTGTYRTTVDVDGSWPASSGAYLDLGSVVTTYRVAVNGVDLPPVDQVDASRIDIGPWLRPGRNEVRVDVASMLGNAVAGSRVNSYGLLGPVRLVPYADTPLTGRR